MRLFGSLAIVSILSFSCFAQAGHLSIALSPKDNVLIGPGPDSTCLDEQAYANHGGQLGTSARGPVILFNDFALRWNSNDKLFVQGITITVNGVGIANGPFMQTLAPAEINALLGSTDGVITGPIVIRSSQKRSLPFASCGLAVASLPLTAGFKTNAFLANVDVRIIGTSLNRDGKASYVEKHVLTHARYFGQ